MSSIYNFYDELVNDFNNNKITIDKFCEKIGQFNAKYMYDNRMSIKDASINLIEDTINYFERNKKKLDNMKYNDKTVTMYDFTDSESRKVVANIYNSFFNSLLLVDNKLVCDFVENIIITFYVLNNEALVSKNIDKNCFIDIVYEQYVKIYNNKNVKSYIKSAKKILNSKYNINF